MKKHLLTVMLVLGLSAAVAFAQAGMGAQQQPKTEVPQASTSSDQMGQQSAPMSEQRPDTMSQDKDKAKDKDKKHSSMANVDDETLHRQVHEQLASNPDLQNVQITVKDGVVNLDGTVPKKEDRKEAKKLAKSVPGVRSVKEHLTVNASAASAAAPSSMGGVSGQASTTTPPPSTEQPSSGAVAGQTGATAGSSTGATTDTTTGATTGTTTAPSTESQAGQTAPSSSGMGQTAAAGAGQPCNAMSGSQTGASTTSGGLTSSIQSELCKEPTLASTDVTVSQQGNQIILSGTVPSNEAKDKAADIAMKFASGMSLVNNIQVGGQASTPPSASSSSSTGGLSGAVGGTTPSAPSSAGQAGISGQAGATTPTPEAGAAGQAGANPPSVSGQAGAAGQTPESGAQGQTGAMGPSSSANPDDQLRSQIETALRNEPTLSNDTISVNATADQIELTGTVANGKSRKTAKRIAESFAGNRKVVDHLKVTGENKSGQTPPDKDK